MIGFGSLFGKKDDDTVLKDDTSSSPTPPTSQVTDPVVMSMSPNGTTGTTISPTSPAAIPVPPPPMPPVNTGGSFTDITPPASQASFSPPAIPATVPAATEDSVLPPFDLSSILNESTPPAMPELENELGIGGMKIEDKVSSASLDSTQSTDQAAIDTIIHGIPSIDTMSAAAVSPDTSPTLPTSEEAVAVLPPTSIPPSLPESLTMPDSSINAPVSSLNDTHAEEKTEEKSEEKTFEPEKQAEPAIAELNKPSFDTASAFSPAVAQKVESAMQEDIANDQVSIKTEEDLLNSQRESLQIHKSKLEEIKKSIDDEQIEIKKAELELEKRREILDARKARADKVKSDLA
jgi:hypothetical protein